MKESADLQDLSKDNELANIPYEWLRNQGKGTFESWNSKISPWGILTDPAWKLVPSALVLEITHYLF